MLTLLRIGVSLCLVVWEFPQGKQVKSVSRKIGQWAVWSMKRSKWKLVEKSPLIQWSQDTAQVGTMALWSCAAQGTQRMGRS